MFNHCIPSKAIVTKTQGGTEYERIREKKKHDKEVITIKELELRREDNDWNCI